MRVFMWKREYRVYFQSILVVRPLRQSLKDDARSGKLLQQPPTTHDTSESEVGRKGRRRTEEEVPDAVAGNEWDCCRSEVHVALLLL